MAVTPRLLTLAISSYHNVPSHYAKVEPQVAVELHLLDYYHLRRMASLRLSIQHHSPSSEEMYWPNCRPCIKLVQSLR